MALLSSVTQLRRGCHDIKIQQLDSCGIELKLFGKNTLNQLTLIELIQHQLPQTQHYNNSAPLNSSLSLKTHHLNMSTVGISSFLLIPESIFFSYLYSSINSRLFRHLIIRMKVPLSLTQTPYLFSSLNKRNFIVSSFPLFLPLSWSGSSNHCNPHSLSFPSWSFSLEFQHQPITQPVGSFWIHQILLKNYSSIIIKNIDHASIIIKLFSIFTPDFNPILIHSIQIRRTQHLDFSQVNPSLIHEPQLLLCKSECCTEVQHILCLLFLLCILLSQIDSLTYLPDIPLGISGKKSVTHGILSFFFSGCVEKFQLVVFKLPMAQHNWRNEGSKNSSVDMTRRMQLWPQSGCLIRGAVVRRHLGGPCALVSGKEWVSAFMTSAWCFEGLASYLAKCRLYLGSAPEGHDQVVISARSYLEAILADFKLPPPGKELLALL
ncbi:hypothetical protein VP01_237g3 [Puccinia sorghi]|uniref:Uncharacterized protein n=1 Tax=Puccinia sorghi TaxID=27349 RepID=A0A0L6V6W0_9BASI|nr:hypothetical protein VP01_237g3 [Puccinia sorghi]